VTHNPLLRNFSTNSIRPTFLSYVTKTFFPYKDNSGVLKNRRWCLLALFSSEAFSVVTKLIALKCFAHTVKQNINIVGRNTFFAFSHNIKISTLRIFDETTMVLIAKSFRLFANKFSVFQMCIPYICDVILHHHLTAKYTPFCFVTRNIGCCLYSSFALSCIGMTLTTGGLPPCDCFSNQNFGHFCFLRQKMLVSFR